MFRRVPPALIERLAWACAGLLILAALFSGDATHTTSPSTARVKPVIYGSRPTAGKPASKAISEIRVGDVVLAAEPMTGDVTQKHVTEVFRSISDHLRILTLVSSSGSHQVLETTDEHPFWVPDKGWTDAADLQIGQKVLQHDQSSATVIATRYEPHPEGIPVYNFATEDYHTYFVAAHGSRAPPVLVHNCNTRGGGTGQPSPRAPRGGLRARMGDPPSGMIRPQAHHDLPQADRFRPHWSRAGLDIDDPAFGRWVEGGPVGDHQKWSKAFNDEWDAFFDQFPGATRDQIIDHMNRLRIDPRFQ